jgi:hypothetical protein
MQVGGSGQPSYNDMEAALKRVSKLAGGARVFVAGMTE